MTTAHSLPGRNAQGLTLLGFAQTIAAIRRACIGRTVPLLLTLCLVASGCANRVQDVLQPLAVAPTDTNRVTMLVATTRKPSQDPGKLYSGDRGTAISLNSVDVSIPPDRNRKIGEVQWPSRMPPKPEREFAVTEVAKVQSEGQALDWYRKNRNSRRQVIIFVHGFNNTYADAVSASRRLSMTPEPMPRRSSSPGRHGGARSTTSMTRRAPTTRVGLLRISSFRPQEVLMFKT
ncbi:Alpha/beta hydrolase of unknown function [Rhizobium mongolense subsp. loessense]|uniref:Alpha/beta hydrolase n=1 Tax=Rhizobium mongolense subsp. loessense TaxID=158890 RepID=A0A1G4PSL8_9HYPH|nr:Alpha/beta hydrolase of unknown function [Rhizobium mongolense subsp. loessense]